jgi:hypothetical protein
MALFRYLAHSMLVFTLATGCSQSLFDDGSGGNGNGDGGTVPSEPDARIDSPDGGMLPVEPDGGMLPVEPDGGAGGPDAAVRPTCPQPCAGDALGDYNSEQGGDNGRWRYVEVQPEQPDSPYVDMTSAILPGPTVGWIGTGVVQPTVAFCNISRDDGACIELEATLALTSPGNAPDAHHPGLMWIAPADGFYYLSGEWRVSSIAPAVPTNVKITRNGHSEILYDQSPTFTTDAYEFGVEVNILEGDRIVLTAAATTELSVTVGVDWFVTGPY